MKLAHQKRLGQVNFIEEIVSGKVNWKNRKVGQVMSELTEGYNLVVSELSRLGRSMLECMEILSVASEKKINVYALKGDWQLNSTIQSKIIAMAFSMASEIESDLISQRTKEALRVKKEQGKKLGRPVGTGKSRLDPFRPEIEALLKNGSTKRFICKRYGVREQTLWKWLKIHKINVGPKYGKNEPRGLEPTFR